jgi:phosphatidyl-myo-inositol alpha-mannosyltransferase
MKPKIIISNYDDIHNPYYGGGGSSAVHEIAKRLNIFYDITVITGRYKRSKNEIHDGIYYKRIGWKYAGPYLGQLIFHFLLPFYVTFMEYDIWIESFTPPFSTTLLPLFTSRPVVGLAHMLSGEDMQRKYRLPFKLAETIGLKVYQYFIVTTLFMKNKVLGINKNAKVEILENGIDKSLLNNKRIAVSPKHILYLGRIEINQKGLDILIESYKSICRKIKYPLIIAGSGTDSEEFKLRQLIDKSGLANKIHFVGRVEGEIKNHLLQDSLCLVMPSRFESFGIVVLEAFAFGVPVVTFSIPSLSWIPDTCSFKVHPYSASELAEKLYFTGKHPDVCRFRGSNGKKFAKNYDWDVIAEKYRVFLNSILNRHFLRSARVFIPR